MQQHGFVFENMIWQAKFHVLEWKIQMMKKSTQSNNFTYVHALKTAVSQCQIGNIDPQYLILGFINFQFNLCQSSAFNAICFFDADNETGNFVYIKHGDNFDKLDMKKLLKNFTKSSSVPYSFLKRKGLNMTWKYCCILTTYISQNFNFLNISRTECETSNI